MQPWETQLLLYCMENDYLTADEFQYLKKKQQQLLQNGIQRDLLTLLEEEYHLPAAKIKELRKKVREERRYSKDALPIANDFVEDKKIISLHHRKDRKTSFNERYKLIREIGRGDLGTYYKASDLEIGREVAIKVFPTDQTHPSALAFLEQETKKMTKCRHHHILPLLDSGRKGKEFFQVYPYIQVQNMAQYFAATPVSIAVKFGLLEHVAQALEYAHNEGITHQNLKPSNILVDQQGRPYLTDFILVKKVTTEDIGYLAPEQMSESRNKQVDVYAFGALLYEILFDHVPSGNREEREAKIATVASPLGHILTQALHAEPEQRYSEVKTLIEEAAPHFSGETPARPAPASVSPPVPAVNATGFSIKGVLFFLLIIAALLVILIGLFLHFRSKLSR